MSTVPAKTLNVYYTNLPSVNYIFKNGKQAIFVSQRFCTDVPAEVEELNYEVSLGHPHIYIKQEAPTIQSNMLDPMEALREKIIAEYKAAQTAAINPENDLGTSDQSGKLNIATSRTIAEAAAGGSGAALVDLASKVVSSSKK
jgi:hypothetical protein